MILVWTGPEGPACIEGAGEAAGAGAGTPRPESGAVDHALYATPSPCTGQSQIPSSATATGPRPAQENQHPRPRPTTSGSSGGNQEMGPAATEYGRGCHHARIPTQIRC